MALGMRRRSSTGTSTERAATRVGTPRGRVRKEGGEKVGSGKKGNWDVLYTTHRASF